MQREKEELSGGGDMFLVARGAIVVGLSIWAAWSQAANLPLYPYWLLPGWVAPVALWLLGERIRSDRDDIGWLAVFGTAVAAMLGMIWAVKLENGPGGVFVLFCAAGFLLGLGFWPQSEPDAVVYAPPPPTTFGSAHWCTPDYMKRHNLVGDDGLIVGLIPGHAGSSRLRYTGDRHLLTFAPTGSGKGTTAIIPNLLTHRSSCLVVDPKGENALITARARAMMGQNIHVVDPWGIATEAGHAARFNPLDWLEVGSADIAENAMILADALIVSEGNGDRFWTDEAKGLLQGLILYVATDELEAGQRHLGRVRDLLTLDGEDMRALFAYMTQSVHYAVRSTGARSLQKEEKLLSNVLASTQAQTGFLDSPCLRENLSASDFRFEDLKTRPTTIYLVLPADRLSAFGRWLRLLIQQAITVSARDIANKPEKPVLFILDEMAALGRLSMVKEAYGLMRGFGIQLWGIIQDAGQLRDLYGQSWEGFVANSGAVMFHGSRDVFTAEYFSKLCGEATVLNVSTSSSHSTTHGFSRNYGPSASGSSSVSNTSGVSFSTSHVQRKLAFPDELMRMGPRAQLVLIEHHPPILAGKLPWFEDTDLKHLGRNLYRERLEAARVLPTPNPFSERTFSRRETA
jgi:type IV secretion system protein VirD4